MITLLKETLKEIQDNDENYEERYLLVYEALYQSLRCGYKAGVRIDPDEPEWPVVYIELPTGQISWHCIQYEADYDGHSTEEKYERIGRFCSMEVKIPLSSDGKVD
ncbi:MAG: hypothetical protein ACTSRU_13000 [Candidatus Hodarchaeales archaeon]